MTVTAASSRCTKLCQRLETHVRQDTRLLPAGQPAKVIPRQTQVRLQKARASMAMKSALLDVQAPSTTPQTGSQDISASDIQEPFSWTKQWWAVAIAEDLDIKRPHAIKLLGKDLVLWCDSSGSWNCFEDRCPHRLAPLSQGRVQGDNLQCSYHGWEFGAGGGCTRIPQADGPAGNARAVASSRSCVASYPVQVRQGLLWVWAESGKDAITESAARGPTLTPYFTEDMKTTPEGTPVLSTGPGFLRDMPLSYEHQMENLADPGHFNFAHHGVAGDRLHERSGEVPISPAADHESVEEMFGGAEGFARRVSMLMGLGRNVENTLHHIIMPCLFTLKTDRPSDIPGVEWELLEIHCIPTAPGHVRLIVRFFFAGHRLPLGMRLGVPLMPQWMSHIEALNVTDGDLSLLEYQDRRTREEMQQTGLPWSKLYYMPTNADTFVLDIRRWIDSRGRGGPFPNAGPPPAIPHEQALDRYSQHTRDCPHCSKALQNLKALRIAAAVAGVILAAAALANAAMTLGSSVAPLWFSASAAVMAWAAAAAHNFVRELTFVGYHHFERD